jgi:hypothetical protein
LRWGICSFALERACGLADSGESRGGHTEAIVLLVA